MVELHEFILTTNINNNNNNNEWQNETKYRLYTHTFIRFHGSPKVKLPHSPPLSDEINGPNLSTGLHKWVEQRTTGGEIHGGVLTVAVLVWVTDEVVVSVVLVVGTIQLSKLHCWSVISSQYRTHNWSICQLKIVSADVLTL